MRTAEGWRAQRSWQAKAPALLCVMAYPDVVIRTLACLVLAALPLLAQKPAPFEVEEATISQVHDAMKAGRLTCRALVEQHLRRIDAYDKNGPAINAIVLMN